MKRVLLVLALASGLFACGKDSPTTATIGPIFVRSGKGNAVFDMPTNIRRVRIQGVWDQTPNSTSNFIVLIGGQLIVNEILRTSITYDGTHETIGGVVSIERSAQISWTITEVIR